MSRSDRLRGIAATVMTVLGSVYLQYRQSGELDAGALATGAVVALCTYGVFAWLTSRKFHRPYSEPATAWFLSRDRLVTSSADGAGESIPVADIRALSPTYSEGAPALEVETDAHTLTILAADREGLVATLHRLRPDIQPALPRAGGARI